jgi:hypothetical protein
VPFEQREAQRVFQVAEQLGCGGLGKVEAGGRSVKVAVLVQRQKKLKVPDLQAGSEEPVRRQGLVRHQNLQRWSALSAILIVIS